MSLGIMPVPIIALLWFGGFVGSTAAESKQNCLLQLKSNSSKAIHQAIAAPAAPSRKLTAADWKSAAGKFFQIDERREGVQETLFAKTIATADSSKLPTCGSPCVAHCIAGQPRDMIRVPGLWKSIKHRLFDQFSDDPVIFALLAMGAETMATSGAEGVEGFVRQPQQEVSNEAVLPSLQFLEVDRAMLLREACTTGTCLQEGLHLKCDAKELGILEPINKETGKYTNMCEVQVSRFRDALELVRDYEEEHNMKFDWVTRPRPDVYFTRPIQQARMLELDSVHVSPWASCGYGGMDWFYAIPRKFADPFAEFASSVSCSDYNSDPAIAKTCNSCAGCECWLAAWMYKKKVPFKALPWQWFSPAKFCGGGCPHDWDVNDDNIMGLDDRTKEMPCVRTEDGEGITCPMLLQSETRVRSYDTTVF